MINPEICVSQAPDLIATKIDGEMVMMDMANGHYYSLDPIGAELWNTMAEPVRVAALCEWLEAEYDAAPGVIRADVVRLLEEMLGRGLLRVAA